MVRAEGRRRFPRIEAVTPRVYRPRRKLPPRPLQMITRGEWSALPFPEDDPGPRLEFPVRHIRYTFTRTPACADMEECIPRIQEIQKDFQDKGHPDIMFNFLVGSDGVIYEGRGWDFKCTGEDYFVNSPGPSINIAYIGTYEESVVPWRMGHAGEHIRKWALYHHFLSKDHEITPSLACFKEGEEDIDYFAESVARFNLPTTMEELQLQFSLKSREKSSTEDEDKDGEDDEDDEEKDDEDKEKEDDEEQDEDKEKEDDEEQDEDKENEDKEDEDRDEDQSSDDEGDSKSQDDNDTDKTNDDGSE